jgi:hypothetical protein
MRAPNAQRLAIPNTAKTPEAMRRAGAQAHFAHDGVCQSCVRYEEASSRTGPGHACARGHVPTASASNRIGTDSTDATPRRISAESGRSNLTAPSTYRSFRRSVGRRRVGFWRAPVEDVCRVKVGGGTAVSERAAAAHGVMAGGDGIHAARVTPCDIRSADRARATAKKCPGGTCAARGGSTAACRDTDREQYPCQPHYLTVASAHRAPRFAPGQSEGQSAPRSASPSAKGLRRTDLRSGSGSLRARNGRRHGSPVRPQPVRERERAS